jgi:hypothetical protein
MTKLYGSPSLAHGVAGLQQWAVRALPSQHFAHAITAVMFLPQAPLAAVLPPYVIAAAYGASNYAAAHLAGQPLWQSYGARAHAALIRNRQKALLLSAQFEVSLGFYLIVLLLTPQRAVLVTYFMVGPGAGAGVGGQAGPHQLVLAWATYGWWCAPGCFPHAPKSKP